MLGQLPGQSLIRGQLLTEEQTTFSVHYHRL